MLQELQLLQYFISDFKITPKKWTVTYNEEEEEEEEFIFHIITNNMQCSYYKLI